MKLIILFLCMSYTHAIISPRLNCQNNPLVCVGQDFYIDNSTEKCHTNELKIDNVTIWSKRQCDSFMPQTLLDWVKCNPVYDYVPKVYENINCSNVVDGVKSQCIQWKTSEYCELNLWIWILMSVAFASVIGVLLYSCGACQGTREAVINQDGTLWTKILYKNRRKRVFK